MECSDPHNRHASNPSNQQLMHEALRRLSWDGSKQVSFTDNREVHIPDLTWNTAKLRDIAVVVSATVAPYQPLTSSQG